MSPADAFLKENEQIKMVSCSYIACVYNVYGSTCLHVRHVNDEVITNWEVVISLASTFLTHSNLCCAMAEDTALGNIWKKKIVLYSSGCWCVQADGHNLMSTLAI